MDLLTVGQIVNTFGTQGELKIVSFSDFSKLRYQPGNRLLLRNESTNAERFVTVTSYRRHRGLDLVKFEEITNETAKQFFGYYVLASKDDIKLPKATYFHADLIGSSIINKEKQQLGIVTDVVDYGAHPILKIEYEQRKYQIPFVPFFIVKVDIDHKEITINQIDGLI